jgi:hypothetical protein
LFRSAYMDKINCRFSIYSAFDRKIPEFNCIKSIYLPGSQQFAETPTQPTHHSDSVISFLLLLSLLLLLLLLLLQPFLLYLPPYSTPSLLATSTSHVLRPPLNLFLRLFPRSMSLFRLLVRLLLRLSWGFCGVMGLRRTFLLSYLDTYRNVKRYNRCLS